MIAESEPGEKTQTELMVQKVHEALEACSGSLHRAGRRLGMTRDMVRMVIFNSPVLRKRWGWEDVKAPDEIDGFARNQIAPDEERLAEAYRKESWKFRENLDKLPMSDFALQIALDLQRLNQGNFRELLDMSNASMGYTIPMLVAEMHYVNRRLGPVRERLMAMGDEMNEDRVYLVEEEKGLHMQYLATSDMLRKIQASAFQSSNLLALIKFRMRNGHEKKAKPGFHPIDVNPT